MDADGDFTSAELSYDFTNLGYGTYDANEGDKAGWTKTGIKTKCTDASGATSISDPYSVTFEKRACFGDLTAKADFDSATEPISWRQSTSFTTVD